MYDTWKIYRPLSNEGSNDVDGACSVNYDDDRDPEIQTLLERCKYKHGNCLGSFDQEDVISVGSPSVNLMGMNSTC